MFGIFGCEACEILTPWPEIKPAPPALEVEVITTGSTAREVPGILPDWKLKNDRH